MDVHRVKELLLDAIYPPTCIVCARSGLWLCDGCLKATTIRHEAGEPVDPYDAVLHVGSYANQHIRKTLTHLKYRSAFCLDDVVRKLLLRFRDSYHGSWPWAGESIMAVTSVPTDERHVRERGFDHAALIATSVRDVLVPWADRVNMLTRTRKALPNAALPTNEARTVNARGLFCTIGTIPESVLVVDDVMTTSATAREAGAVLKLAGVKRLYLVTMAKGT